MAERLKAQHWKCCLGVTLTRVRIPLSPFLKVAISQTIEYLTRILMAQSFLVDGTPIIPSDRTFIFAIARPIEWLGHGDVAAQNSEQQPPR